MEQKYNVDFSQRLTTYIGDSKADTVKENYRFLEHHIQKTTQESGDHFNPQSILDMGCATGDLVFFLEQLFPQSHVKGVDLHETLIETAQQRLTEMGKENISFEVGNALSYRSEESGKFDVVTCFGVMGIFDDFKELLGNLIANTHNGGRVYVHGLMNKDDIDVQIRYNDHLSETGWMRGFNIFSRKQISQYLSDLNPQIACNFYDFKMQSELPKREDFPHRAHTMPLVDGTLASINGLCLILPETLMEIIIPE